MSREALALLSLLRASTLALLLFIPSLARADDGLSKDDLGQLPDDKARALAKSFVEAVSSEDPPSLLAMVPARGITKNKKKLTPAATKAAIVKSGIDKFIGGDGPFRVDVSKRQGPWFGLYRGSGYGRTQVWFFKKEPSGEWLLTEAAVVNFGPP